MKKQTVAVIFGGRSQEYEASVGSAAQISAVLKKEKKYSVVEIGITKTGEWFSGKNTIKVFQSGTTKGLYRAVLAPDTSRKVHLFKGKKFIKSITIDIAFPWIPGPYGEDGTMQGLLEMADIPYVGSPVFASACGFNKLMTKLFLNAVGIPQATHYSMTAFEWKNNKAAILKEIPEKLRLPLFVKPVSCGSSIGVSKVKSLDQLEKAIKDAFVFDQTVLIEEGIANAAEVECSVLGNTDLTVAIPGQVEFDGEFYDFNAKYLSQKWGVTIPPALPKETVEKVRMLAAKIFKALGAAGGARIDFLVNKKTNEVFFNEINTTPSFRDVSMFSRLLDNVGLDYAKIINRLIKLALERYAETSQRTLDFSSGSDWYKKA